MPEFRINISNLSEGLHDYTFESKAELLELPSEYIGTVSIQAHLEKSNRQLFLRATVQGSVDCTCDRCLEGFRQAIETRYTVVYAPDDRSMAGVKKEEDEVQILPPDANYVDLDEDVRQYLIIAVPQKMLCAEDCKGICPACGANKNRKNCNCNIQETDSRWEVLKKLSKN